MLLFICDVPRRTDGNAKTARCDGFSDSHYSTPEDMSKVFLQADKNMRPGAAAPGRMFFILPD